MDFWTLFELIAILTLSVLVGKYVAEHWVEPAWECRTKPMSVNELLREWIICVVLFGGLSALVHGTLRLACWTVC